MYIDVRYPDKSQLVARDQQPPWQPSLPAWLLPGFGEAKEALWILEGFKVTGFKVTGETSPKNDPLKGSDHFGTQHGGVRQVAGVPQIIRALDHDLVFSEPHVDLGIPHLKNPRNDKFHRKEEKKNNINFGVDRFHILRTQSKMWPGIRFWGVVAWSTV